MRPDVPLQFDEVNLFQRGMVPLVGFKSTSVCYECHERMAGQPHYPFSKMVALAGDGITSLSVMPIAWAGDGRVAREPRGQCMAACASRHGRHGNGLDLHHRGDVLYGSHPDALIGRHRRVCGQGLYGDQASSPLDSLQAHLGERQYIIIRMPIKWTGSLALTT